MAMALSQLSPETRPVLIASGFVPAILVLGWACTLATAGTAPLPMPGYLLQKLQAGAFLGIVATGMMMVILPGHIDLPVPWTMTAATMVATAVGGPRAIPAGLAVGLAAGPFNGLGVSVLRIPSMIFALGVDSVLRGLMVAQTGGLAPQDRATDTMRLLAAGKRAGVPAASFVWLAVWVGIAVLLRRTAFGREIHATGTCEAAAYLAGIRSRRVIVGAFAASGLCAALAGVLLAGCSAKACQGIGTPFLPPAIAAVVIGGTRFLGGQGRYAGTFAGVVLIVLLNSVLSIMQMPEAGRQVIHGSVILCLLLVHGRSAQSPS